MKLIISFLSIALIVAVYFNVVGYWCAIESEPVVVVAQEFELSECLIGGKVFHIVERY